MNKETLSKSPLMSNDWTKWFMTAVMNHYADFNGRARRKEYWRFVLIQFVVSIVLSIIDSIIGIQILSGIWGLALLCPGVAVGIRRLHDIGKSGWWMLVALVPLLGAIYLIYLLVQDSQPGDNQYGPNPKAGEAVPPAAPAA